MARFQADRIAGSALRRLSLSEHVLGFDGAPLIRARSLFAPTIEYRTVRPKIAGAYSVDYFQCQIAQYE